jgi:hypothetical protein
MNVQVFVLRLLANGGVNCDADKETQSHEHQDRYNVGVSDSLRQMLADRLDENLQVSERLEHE